MSFISSVFTKAQGTEKIVTGKQASSDKRAALINRLCDSLGTEYRGLKQYRSL